MFHGAPEILTLRELMRNYSNLVEASTRVMLQIKVIYRGTSDRECAIDDHDLSRCTRSPQPAGPGMMNNPPEPASAPRRYTANHAIEANAAERAAR